MPDLGRTAGAESKEGGRGKILGSESGLVMLIYSISDESFFESKMLCSGG